MPRPPDPGSDALDARVVALIDAQRPEEAYELILAQLGPGVRGLLRARTGSDLHGDNLFDELREMLWMQLPALRDRIGQTAPGHERCLTLRAWLYRCALNSFRNWRVRRSRDNLPMPSAADHILRASGPGPSTLARYNEMLAQITEALTEAEMEVFILRTEREFSFGEIAAALELSEGAARQSFHRARQKVKDLLGRSVEAAP